ncbi:MAG: divalent-cation tolerance protein CutA [Bacteroidetes bacterium]|nr:divalent-cation tolerance protein CutA [Bacteroidota bacterium]
MLYEKIDKKDKDIVFIYTTCPTVGEARDLGLSAVKDKLAVSADYWMINSIYPWDKVIQEGEQYMLMLATQKALSEQLIKYLEIEHSYSVPVIVQCDISFTNQPYHFWADNVLSSKDEYITETEDEIKKKNERGSHYDRLK